MGTRGNYIFRYKGKCYVFYNHFDSYFSGLGEDIVRELKSWTAEDFELAKVLLERFPSEVWDDASTTFDGLMKVLKNPTGYCIEAINGVDYGGQEYTYTLDFDRNLFIVRWIERDGPEKQRYRLNNIPGDWVSLTCADES
jgi:hypothetical protein